MPAPLQRFSVAVLAVGFAGLIGYGAGVRSRAGSGPGDLSAPRRAPDDCRQSDAELECRRQVVQDRLAAKDRAARDLLAGRLTLGQAAARLRDIEERLPAPWEPPRPTRGLGEAERLCRDVIALAHGWVAENLPAAAPLVAALLEAELGQLRGPDGVVRLPDG